MARSRLELRKEAEAVAAREEQAEATGTAKKSRKKATTTRTKKVKEKAVIRKRLVWVVYSGSMKEEGRFAYDKRNEAEEKIELLKTKSKRMYFIQPVKEIIGEDGAVIAIATKSEFDDEPAAKKKKTARKVADDDDDDETPDTDDDDDDE